MKINSNKFEYMFGLPTLLSPQDGTSVEEKPLVKYIPETDEEINADIQAIEKGIISSFSKLGIEIDARLEKQPFQTEEEYDEETAAIIAGMQNSVMYGINSSS